MGYFQIKVFVCLIAVSVFAIYSNALPNDASASVGTAGAGASASGPAAPGATNSNSSNATETHFSGDLEQEEETPETAELDKAIDELKVTECIVLLGECWLLLKNTKPYLSEEHRLKMCQKTTQGFAVCDFLNDDQAEQAKEEAIGREKAEEEEKVENERKTAERNEKLKKRKEALEARWNSMREEARMLREGGNATMGNSTEVPVPDASPVNPEVEEEPEPEANAA